MAKRIKREFIVEGRGENSEARKQSDLMYLNSNYIGGNDNVKSTQKTSGKGVQDEG